MAGRESPAVRSSLERVSVNAGEVKRGGFSGDDVEQEQVTTSSHSRARDFEDKVIGPVASIARRRKLVGVGRQRLPPADHFARIREFTVRGETIGPSGAVAEVDRMVVAGIKLFDGKRIIGRKVTVQRPPRKSYISKTSSETSCSIPSRSVQSGSDAPHALMRAHSVGETETSPSLPSAIGSREVGIRPASRSRYNAAHHSRRVPPMVTRTLPLALWGTATAMDGGGFTAGSSAGRGES